MKMSRILFVALGLLVIIGFGCSSEKKEETAASGQGTPVMRCQERFAELDVNKDGKITLQEFTAVPHPGGNAELIFKARDKDVDGVLVVEEFCQGKGLGKGPGAGKQ